MLKHARLWGTGRNSHPSKTWCLPWTQKGDKSNGPDLRLSGFSWLVPNKGFVYLFGLFVVFFCFFKLQITKGNRETLQLICLFCHARRLSHSSQGLFHKNLKDLRQSRYIMVLKIITNILFLPMSLLLHVTEGFVFCSSIRHQPGHPCGAMLGTAYLD